MTLIRNFLVIALTVALSSPLVAQTERETLWKSLVERVHNIDYSQVSDREAVRLLLEASLVCHEAEKPELASEYLQDAIEFDKQDPKRGMKWTLFNHAIKIGQFELAKEIAESPEHVSDNMLDRLAVENYKLGDKKAILGYPREELDLFNALNIAAAYGELGEYEKLDEFVTGIVSLPSNDPLGVGAITYENLAKKFRDEGDTKNAKKFIDKAMQIGGNLFYTGYAIQITKRSIYGTLTKDVETFARKGAAYRGHMGRELVTNLIVALAQNGNFSEATKLVPLIDEEEDRSYAFRLIAIEQAKQKQFKDAIENLRAITDKSMVTRTRLEIAGFMWEAKKQDDARAIIQTAREEIEKDEDLQTERLYGSLAFSYGLMNSTEDVEKIIEDADAPLKRANRLVMAMKGVAESFKN